ncbi:outer membrane beta-barrel protein [Fibrella sp. ES10-3-2-2]
MMKNLYIFWLLYFWTTGVISAQSRFNSGWDERDGDTFIGVNLSTSRYNGDLSERYNFKHLQLSWGIEGNIRHRFTDRWSVSGQVGAYHLRADQRFTKNAANALTFATTNFSTNLRAEWDMLSVDGNQRNVVYLFFGIGATKLSPTTTLNSATYSLPDFQTEGNKYNLWAGQVSYGVGFPMVLSESFLLRIEGRYTHVLSDYLDDVSDRYSNKAAATDLEKQLADKRIAENLPPNPVGEVRGNPLKNDGYFLFTLQLLYKL